MEKLIDYEYAVEYAVEVDGVTVNMKFHPLQRAEWITVHGYTTCSNCGMHGYRAWKRCPVCECKMS